MKVIKHIILVPLIIALIILALFPLYYLLVTAFTSNEKVDKGIQELLPDGIHFESFRQIDFKEFGLAFLLTFISVIILNVFKLASVLLSAIGLVKLSKTLRKILFIFFLFASFIPEISIYLYILTIVNKSGIRVSGDYYSIGFVLSLTMMFSFFMLIIFYNTINQEYQQKRQLIKVDNLKMRHIFFQVFLPKLKVPIYLLIIFTTIDGWNSYLWPQIILSGEKLDTISTIITRLGQKYNQNLYNVTAAGAVISTIIPLGIYIIWSRFINKRMYNMVG
ncbi:ABC transporter permease subunit [Mycoplasma sp. E35C]|uniref:ABC transporter permease subunit n=1 Tax=Mycoplasma sp. E35C TaxID=2801918 RepID=UPI001CA4532B|nr:ABC transporter permease subunit [Mycoplasma sp. E35C]QZX49357.1 carbohydrate ABC transporter permease [Mycoplasma sp. E35C]